MANEETGQKNKPPTEQHLRKLRNREGQVARSSDFPTAVSLLVLCALLVFQSGAIVEKLQSQLEGVTEAVVDPTSINFSSRVFELIMAGAATVWPFLVLSVGLYVAASIIATKGLVASGKNMAPKFDRLNPVDGFKKIFGLRAVSQLGKLAVKIALIGLVLFMVFRLYVNDTLWAPVCGASCVYNIYSTVILTILFSCLTIMVLVALADLKITDALFRHENKMSEADIKRERKEDNGSPEVRSEIARLRREFIEEENANPSPAKNTVDQSEATVNSVVFYVLSKSVAVGLEYAAGSRKAPKVISITSRAEHNEDGTRFVLAPLLADDIARTVPVGGAIANRHYSTIANIMVRLDVDDS